MNLTIETDDAVRMKTLVVLADIVFNTETCHLEHLEIVDEICFFADLFKMYLAEDDPKVRRSYRESEELIQMIRSLESVVTVMRAPAEPVKEIKDAN